ncbi:hypothetical protein SAMN05660461_1417 [Chitinophaga ginsengisegetis]|uniref:DUF1680 family protein n=1 Tax=Chitinophaga ginsengisegetis TaxID=393003 RepID=A0A1T5NGJ4_9BACT|nr:glycoside hydrolase family 127 protein [Chitinophaga ginsengisegetis]SKC99238.1 hypothetical protein SAMN05660461_1417 [Chitinophaga ginsengisegetis]
MKKICLFISICAASTAWAQVKDYPVKSVNFTAVQLTDSFWLPRLRTNHLVTIPASFERCENTGRVKNFEMAAAHSGKFCTTFPFDDTDIYKTIEGASFSLSLFPDKKLDNYIDSLIVKVANAQEKDGYLYTARTINPAAPHSWAGPERWVKEREGSHELYNAGHLYEAAFAHYYATGKKTLLNIALKNADLVCSVFGPGKKHVAPGHEIVEMGLVKLYRITGKPAYLETAKFFIEERGRYTGYDSNSKDPWKSGTYWQDDKPVTEQYEVEGHAVRAGYLYAAMADVAALTGDKSLLQAVDTIWQNMVTYKMYVQGGLGAIPSGERFGDNYELPNTTAYNETCAAIAGVYWNYRMFLLHGDAKYMDVLEKMLYNGLISGLGLDGKSFFYSNAMQVKNSFSHKHLEPERAGWFECSCCPTNLTRLIPSIPGYVYAQKDNNVYVNLFVASRATLKVSDNTVSINQQNQYPWNGDLVFNISPAKKPVAFNFLVRIPGWAQNTAVPSGLYTFTGNNTPLPVIRVNGVPVTYNMEKGYAVIARTWKKNDRVEVVLPMEVRKIKANEKVKDDAGKVALQRGPIVYCGEWADNNGSTSNIIIPSDAVFATAWRPELLNGVTVISSQVPAVHVSNNGLTVSTTQQTFTAIPYYAWANRGKGEMMVWFPEKVNDIDLLTSKQEERIISK